MSQERKNQSTGVTLFLLSLHELVIWPWFHSVCLWDLHMPSWNSSCMSGWIYLSHSLTRPIGKHLLQKGVVLARCFFCKWWHLLNTLPFLHSPPAALCLGLFFFLSSAPCISVSRIEHFRLTTGGPGSLCEVLLPAKTAVSSKGQKSLQTAQRGMGDDVYCVLS